MAVIRSVATRCPVWPTPDRAGVGGWWAVLALALALDLAACAVFLGPDVGPGDVSSAPAAESPAASRGLMIPLVDRTRLRQSACRQVELSYGMVDPCS